MWRSFEWKCSKKAERSARCWPLKCYPPVVFKLLLIPPVFNCVIVGWRGYPLNLPDSCLDLGSDDHNPIWHLEGLPGWKRGRAEWTKPVEVLYIYKKKKNENTHRRVKTKLLFVSLLWAGWGIQRAALCPRSSSRTWNPTPNTRRPSSAPGTSRSWRSVPAARSARSSLRASTPASSPTQTPRRTRGTCSGVSTPTPTARWTLRSTLWPCTSPLEERLCRSWSGPSHCTTWTATGPSARMKSKRSLGYLTSSYFIMVVQEIVDIHN